MKTQSVLSLLLVLMILFLCSCTPKIETTMTGNDPSADSYVPTETPFADTDSFTRQWYDTVIEGLSQENIQTSVETSGAVAEFRVLKNFALLGYYYYSLQVYEDDTAKFTFMVYHGEYFDDGELLLDESKKLSAAETKQLLACFEKNDFWNIPTVHPDENLGVDGCTVFIEGKSGRKTHFISMWGPEKHHSIDKIFRVFDMFSEMIAENPLAE